MTYINKNPHRKISITDNIQIQKTGCNVCIYLIDKTTGKSCELTEATLEVIISSNNMIKPTGCLDEYRANNLIIEQLIKQQKKYIAGQKAQRKI